jgi:hypothetical protein
MKSLKVACFTIAVVSMVAVCSAQGAKGIEPMPGEPGYLTDPAGSVDQGPLNDLCADATLVSVPSLTAGTTVGSTLDNDADPCGPTGVTTAGVWYRVVGTGNTMTATFCSGGGGAAYDTKLHVYCDTCVTKTCIDSNDDTCGLQSEVSWCSQVGYEYLIYVSGYGGATGTFDLYVTDDGAACPDPGICSIVPVELMGFDVE